MVLQQIRVSLRHIHNAKFHCSIVMNGKALLNDSCLHFNENVCIIPFFTSHFQAMDELMDFLRNQNVAMEVREKRFKDGIDMLQKPIFVCL